MSFMHTIQVEEELAACKEELAEVQTALEITGGVQPGKSTAQQVKAELTDYMNVLEDVSIVYDEITAGRFSKPNTAARYITERVRELAEEDVNEAVKELEAERTQLRKDLQEMVLELHAAINEPMYAGTRQDWIDRAYAAEAELEQLRAEGDSGTCEIAWDSRQNELRELIKGWKAEIEEFATHNDSYYNAVRQSISDLEAILE